LFDPDNPQAWITLATDVLEEGSADQAGIPASRYTVSGETAFQLALAVVEARGIHSPTVDELYLAGAQLDPATEWQA